MELTYDKGTIVFSGNCSELPQSLKDAALVWDDRIQKFRASAHRYFEFVWELTTRGIPFRNLVYYQMVLAEWHEILLRNYQREALEQWLRTRRGIICLPTGAGKTRVAMAAIAALKVPTLCLVPTKILMEQWVALIKDLYPGPCGEFGDNKRCVLPVTVATFESAYRHMSWMGNRFKLIVIDEVHHFGNGLRDEALMMSAAPWRLGLTATKPEECTQLNRLCELVGPTLYEIRIESLVGTYLSPYELVRIPIRLNSDERFRYDREYQNFKRYQKVFFKTMPDGTFQLFIAFCSKSKEGQGALASYYRTRRILSYSKEKKSRLNQLLQKHRDQKILIFTADKSTAFKISFDHLIPIIASDISRKERLRIIEDFKLGLVGGIVSCKVLNEGYDIPDAEIAIILGGSSESREFVQRIGRVLRPHKDKHAIVYEMVTEDSHETKHSQARNRTITHGHARATQSNRTSSLPTVSRTC